MLLNRLKRSRLLLSLAGNFTLLLLASQLVIAERLPLKAYTTAEGLPHNLINKIVRDSRGFLWFCTADGLSRFDGYGFTNFSTDDGLPHRNVNDFLETREGEFWVATDAGLVRFDPRGIRSKEITDTNTNSRPPRMFSVVLPPDDDRRARAFTVLVEGRDGTIWCGTAKSLYRLARANGEYHLDLIQLGSAGAYPKETYILDLLEDRNGSLWIASFGWLCRRWPDGTTARYSKADSFPDENFHDLFEDSRGRLWAATRLGGFVRFSADQSHAAPIIVAKYGANDGLNTNWVSQIFETSGHRFWLTTNHGLAEFFPDEQEHKFKTYGQQNGLLYHGVNAITEDAGGNVWLASDAGAMKLARDGFISYGEQDGLLSVYAIFGDQARNVCFRAAVFGDAHTSIFEGAKSDLSHPLENFYARYGCFDGRQFSWLMPNAIGDAKVGWVGEMVTLQARNAEWWIGTGQGLYRFPPSVLVQLKAARPIAVYTTKDGLTAAQLFRLFEDSRGDIWASCIQPNGLARWDRATETWHDLTNDPSLPFTKDDLARSFGEDREGNLWVGFNTGVARFRGARFDFFTVREGLPPGSVMNFLSDQQGRLWATSARSGLIRIDNPDADRPTFTNLTTKQGLSSNSTEAIAEDLTGHIYVGTGRGLDRLEPATGHIKHFTTADGLAPGEVKAIFAATDGTLWIGTSKGLSRFQPGKESTSGSPPILITAISVAGEESNVSALGEREVSLPELAADRNQLQINFVGLSFAAGEVLRYQYKLEGSDADWNLPTEQRTVNYANLAPGHYRFLVRAVNADGVMSVAPAVITFSVLRPLWQRWWFIALALITLGMIVYLLYRYRVARIVELANVRTRIATDLHDDIGTNLTKIAVLSEVVKQQHAGTNDGVGNALSSIARISRESVAAMGDIVWAINPQRDNLLDLVRRMRQHAEEVCVAQNIELVFRAPASEQRLKLPVDVRRDLYLIFKEAVNNAVRHSGCSRLEIEIKENRHVLVLSVRDNGKGFDPEREAEGNGRINMRRRAAAHAGTLVIESSPGAGTAIEVRLPHPQSHWLFPTQTRG